MSLREIVEYWATECDIELTNGEASLLIKLVEEKFKSDNTAMVPCSEIEKILNMHGLKPYGKVVAIQNLLAQHQ